MKKLTLLISCLSASLAMASQPEIDEVIDLATQIRLAARTTNATTAELNLVNAQLREILNVLNNASGGNGGPNSECFKFAYSKYYQTQDSTTATDNALVACRKVADMKVVQFLYSKYYQTMDAAKSMDNSAARATFAQAGKLDMIEFAYSKYYQILDAATSATRGSELVAKVRVGNLDCLKTLFSKYYQTMNGPDAMDKAGQGCQ